MINAAQPPLGTNQQQDRRSDGAQAAPGPDAHHHALLGALGHGSGRKAWIALSLSMVCSVKTLAKRFDQISWPARGPGMSWISLDPVKTERVSVMFVRYRSTSERDGYAPQGPSQRAIVLIWSWASS